MNHHCQRKAEDIGHNMLLAAFYLLVAIYTTVCVYVVGGLDASRVNDSEARTFVSSRRSSDLLDKYGQYFLESSVILPLAKVVVDQVPWSEIFREHTPLAAGLDNIEDGVKYLSERVFAPTVGKFYVRNNHLPLIISDVGWVRCHNFEVLESLYKVTDNHPNNALIFNYLTNKITNIGWSSLDIFLNQI